MQFTRATKRQAKLRLALIGPAGSGKTYTALAIATHLGAKVALLDTERGSAVKYADDPFVFDTIALDSFSPEACVEAVHAAELAGYDVLVIDSWSAFWTGKDGALEQVDNATKRSRSKNAFTDGWREVTPMHTRMIDAIISSKLHVIATMRTKTEYVLEEDEKGRKVPRKVGLAPVQRAGVEYEFDITADLDQDNNLIVDKTRCRALKGKVYKQAGEEMALVLKAWLTDGAPALEDPLFASIAAELRAADTPESLGKAKQRIIRSRNDKSLSPKALTELIDIGTRRKEELELAQAPTGVPS